MGHLSKSPHHKVRAFCIPICKGPRFTRLPQKRPNNFSPIPGQTLKSTNVITATARFTRR